MICEKCKGCGRINEIFGDLDCSDCKGTGKVNVVKRIIKCPKCKDTGGLEHVHEFANGTILECFCNTCGKVSLLDIHKPENQEFIGDV